MAGLFDRIKNTISKLAPPKLPAYAEGDKAAPGDAPPGDVPGEIVDAEPISEMDKLEYLSAASHVSIIRKAARNRLLLYMQYNNMWRYVEPYSFRPGKQGQLFYGHCLAHNDTHSFYMHRIQDLQISEVPFSPRWHIEI